ncbi:MAG: 8-oxo-dGTP diphosphatase [Verrucomicrobiota bacterium]|nr:8-oxo-dGTP diphosphatase [Verrucomicrobiota bacterium]
MKHGKVLLIRKKRGLGAGKINGPGGKIDPGETALASAVRETFEELCVTPLHVRQTGELFFEFQDGLRLHGAIFLADDFSGTPTETAEAVPLWTAVDAIPYDDMWADDRYWLPLLLAGAKFRGAFVFEGDRLLARRVERLADETEFVSC